jgi:hypothetical protein
VTQSWQGSEPGPHTEEGLETFWQACDKFTYVIVERSPA